MSVAPQPSPLREVIALFTRLGVTGFGGPAVTIAMMEDECVTRRKWLDRDHFLDLVGATNLIPGPNATELAIHLGYLRAGWPGFLAAGACFILPAAFITLALAWAYVHYGALPAVGPFLAGVKPAVLAAVVMAVARLGQRAVKSWKLGALGLAVAAAALLGVNEILAIFVGGLVGMAWLHWKARDKSAGAAAACLAPWPLLPLALGTPAAAVGVTLVRLGLYFLQVGALLYGTGYVLIAFLEGGLVRDWGWLTQQQLLDAVAAGQLTPGPLLSTATFIGYLLQGPAGAVVATVAVFAPSFLLTLLLTWLMPHLRRTAWSAAFLDAINVCSIGLMAAVALRLGWTTLVSWQAGLIALVAALLAWRWKINSAWLVLGGGLAGWLLGLLPF